MTKFYGTSTHVLLDWDAMADLADNVGNPCYLVALDEQQLLVLHSVIRLAEWTPARWVSGNKDTVDAFIAELECCLMSGCNVSDLIQTQRMMVAALIGEAVDFADPLPASVDYTETGIGPRIEALEVKLEELRALQEASDTTNSENVDDIEEILDGIGQILGAAAVLL